MKNLFLIVKLAVFAVAVCLVSCTQQTKVVTTNPFADTTKVAEQSDFMKKVHESSVVKTNFVSSKLKFTVEIGPQRLNLTGNLRMKRDDVIRLQLMAFGFVEAGRIEFTKDYVLLMDRINKQFIQVPYKYIDFLRNSNIDFFTLQALFWNELFIPGEQAVVQDLLKNFAISMGGDEAVISLEKDRLNYSWLANEKTGRIKMANIMYRDPVRGNAQLNWDYDDYGPLAGRLFPTDMIVTLTLPTKEVKLGIKLNYLGTASEWETRTVVPEKYRKVDIDEMLRRFMSL